MEPNGALRRSEPTPSNPFGTIETDKGVAGKKTHFQKDGEDVWICADCADMAIIAVLDMMRQNNE
jgi:hypothetical protein